MLDIIATGLTALTAARDITKGIAGLKEDVAVQIKAAELLTIIADAQGSLNEAQARIYELQAQLRDARDALAKRADFDRYALAEPYPGSYVWKLRSDARLPDEPMHYICPLCKEEGVVTVLQATDGDGLGLCKKCRKNFRIGLAPGVA